MFENLTQKAIRKLNKIGGLEKIIVALPCDNKVVLGIEELEDVLEGEGKVQ